MVAGQVGEVMAVAVVHVAPARNTEEDLVLILDHRTEDVIALDLLLKQEHATYRPVQVIHLDPKECLNKRSEFNYLSNFTCFDLNEIIYNLSFRYKYHHNSDHHYVHQFAQYINNTTNANY